MDHRASGITASSSQHRVRPQGYQARERVDRRRLGREAGGLWPRRGGASFTRIVAGEFILTLVRAISVTSCFVYRRRYTPRKTRRANRSAAGTW